MTEAHHETKLSYSAISDVAHGHTESPRRDTIERLQRWSQGAIEEHGVYISAAKTLGLGEPDTKPVAASGGR